MFHWYPKRFNVDDSVRVLKEYELVFLYAYLFYLPLCQILTKFYNPKYVETIKYYTTMWNMLICGFSFVGTFYTLPFLVKCLYTDGLDSMLLLQNPECNFQQVSSVSFWCTLFVGSKVPELLDTFLYILKNGKQHIFLHWYHHLFTGVYAYYAAVKSDGPSNIGLWMTAINFFVHTFMYAYYMIVENFEHDSVIRIWTISKSWFITSIQISQMIILLFIFLYDKFKLGNKFDHFGFNLYLIFAILFINLYIEKYHTKKKN